MSVAELRGKIATVNATVARLNEQRVRNMGMRETLEKQKSNAMAMYLEKYGVDLSTTDIKAEFQRVMDIKEAEVNLMTEVIGCIDRGEYARANQLMGISVEETKSADTQPSQSNVAEPQVQQTVASPTSHAPNQVVSQQPQVSAPLTGVESLVSPAVSAPIPSVVAPPPTPAVAPPPMSRIDVPEMPLGAPPIIPQVTVHGTGVGLDLSGLQMNVEAVNRATDFSGILGGQPFTQ